MDSAGEAAVTAVLEALREPGFCSLCSDRLLAETESALVRPAPVLQRCFLLPYAGATRIRSSSSARRRR